MTLLPIVLLSSPLVTMPRLAAVRLLALEIAAGSAVSLEHDVLGRAPSGSFDAFAGRFAFIDIGTPESLKLAEHVFIAKFEHRLV